MPDEKTFRKKVARPVIRVTEEMINPEFVNRSGLHVDDIISKMKYELRRDITARKYIERIKRAYSTVKGVPAKRVKDALDIGEVRYCLDMTFGGWRFTGPLDGKGRGPFALAESWLSNSPKAPGLLRKQDEVVLGGPVLIATPKNTPRLKEKLHNQLMRSGSFIVEAHYDSAVITEENDKINGLVNKFISKKFVPFGSSGASHLDFVLHPESVIPADSPAIRQIHYNAYAFFQGRQTADDLRKRCIETHRVAPVNPQDYIGWRTEKAYFDMHLDIQVTAK